MKAMKAMTQSDVFAALEKSSSVEEGLQGGNWFPPGPRCLGLEEPREVRDPRCVDDQAPPQEGDAGRQEDGVWQGDQGEGEARVQGGEVLRPEEPEGQLLSVICFACRCQRCPTLSSSSRAAPGETSLN